MNFFWLELKLRYRRLGDALLPVFWFVLVAVLVPFGVGPEPQILARLAPGIVLLSALLASLLALPQLWRDDYECGLIDQYRLSATALEWIAVLKGSAHFLCLSAPIVLATPLVAVLLNLPSELIPRAALVVALSLAAATAFSLIAGAVTVSLARGAMLQPLILMPPLVPCLIFAAGALARDGAAANSALKLLIACTLFSLAVAPFAAAGALRLQSR
jgi:heme exporter protein B